MASPQPTLAGNVAQCLRPGESQNVAYAVTAGTIATPVKGTVLRVTCSTDAFIAIGPDPTATTSDMYVVGNQPEYFRCSPGDKVSAIRSLVTGVLYVTEMD